MTGFGVELRDVSVRFGATVALGGVTAAFLPGAISGLLGRNGSGKTTLLSTIAAFRRPSGGSVRVDGEAPWENPRVLAGIALVREAGDVPDVRVGEVLRYGAAMRSTWSGEVAERLLARFDLPRRKRVEHLSRGQRGALAAVVGIASRAPLTLLDEVTLGMDAPARYACYDELLADYLAHPRTVVLASHLIEEVDRLLEHVIVLDRGRVLVADEADALRARGVRVSGEAERVDAFVGDARVLRRETLGRSAVVTLYGDLGSDARARAREKEIEMHPLPLQDLFVDLTDRPGSADRPGGAR
ncbi:MAG: ABC transporter ATP-binding protein [Trueperaceae bacterium]|nr:MAG: ABC transporter ATP-binding protein [Trueperaceae bacterium]